MWVLRFIDLGINVPPEKFVAVAQAKKPDVIAMSALLTTTMGAMRETIAALEKAGVREKVKIIIGGAPVSQAFAEEIGADGYGSNAGAAAELVKRLIKS